MRIPLGTFTKKVLYFLEGVFAQKRTVCPYCGSSDFKVVATKARVIQVCLCQDCSLYWMNPIFYFPKFYDMLYREEGIAALSDLKKAREIVRNHFFDKDIDARPIIGYLASLVQGRKLLEIGCSWGYFLAQAKEFGFEGSGVEISDKRRQLAEKLFGVHVVPSAGQLIAQQKTFDVIYCRQTLEHVGDYIRSIFTEMHALLADHGVIVLEVPRLHPERGNRGFQIMGAVHPFGFTREFFLRNMPKCGFSVTVKDGYSDVDEDWYLVVVLRKEK